MKKSNKTTFFMVLFFFIGLIVLLYPSVSDYSNKKLQSRAIDNYEELLKDIEKVDYDNNFKDAVKYNGDLAELNNPLISYKKLEDPSNILSINGSGMMGYISIEKIRVELPIYYGTTEQILNTSVGLLEGTSLPAGEIGMHAVLSAHRGLPSSKLFTELDKMEIGDTFIVKVLDRTMAYEVDQVLIVLPDEVDSLAIDKDQEIITLMTCTPYGINSHRMLVRAHRVENTKIKSYVSTEAFKVDKLVVTPLACLPIIFIWMLAIAFKPIEKNKNYINKYIYPSLNEVDDKLKPSKNFEDDEISIFNKYVYPQGENISS